MEHEPVGGGVVVGDDFYYAGADGDAGRFFLFVAVGCDRYWLD